MPPILPLDMERLKRARAAAVMEKGRGVYLSKCAICHGNDGMDDAHALGRPADDRIDHDHRIPQHIELDADAAELTVETVSYTHLDVYKRQA